MKIELPNSINIELTEEEKKTLNNCRATLISIISQMDEYNCEILGQKNNLYGDSDISCDAIDTIVAQLDDIMFADYMHN